MLPTAFLTLWQDLVLSIWHALAYEFDNDQLDRDAAATQYLTN